jgi:very-short-patch-repair endonuclease
MHSIERAIRRRGWFLRRRDLLALGFTDRDIRSALGRKRIFRVRQGWYSVPDAPEPGIRAVRVGGRLTALSALESYGLIVPRPSTLQVAVRPTASRLRHPADRRRRLTRLAGVTVYWTQRRTPSLSPWRESIADALVAVLSTEGRDVAVAACSAALHAGALNAWELDRVFDRAPARVRRWRSLVSAADESHGETFARLWFGDAAIACEQQVHVEGVGWLDFRLRPNLYFEVDGGQHGEPDQWQKDHQRDLAIAATGGRTIRVSYSQLLGDWPGVLLAVERAIADAEALAARRLRHPYRPRQQRKRRRSAAKLPP